MKIKKLRKKLGLTQKQMGELMGMPQQAVGRIEVSARGSKETKQQIVHLVALELLAEAGWMTEFRERLAIDEKNNEIQGETNAK